MNNSYEAGNCKSLSLKGQKYVCIRRKTLNLTVRQLPTRSVFWTISFFAIFIRSSKGEKEMPAQLNFSNRRRALCVFEIWSISSSSFSPIL